MKEVLKFDFCYETKISDSFRIQSLIGQYDLENKKVIQHFKGDYKLPKNWNIGLIVGNSGTGKTSIAKNVFGKFNSLKWNDKALIENFDKNLSMDQITYYLGNVGFNAVPYWLKPFKVLSNGEKQRVELARLASENDFILFDEFTSLVDRDVAKSMANSVQKMIRKNNKQFVAVTCHKDIQEWLLPDWVYDTDEKIFFCPKNKENKNSNSQLTESKKKHGTFIKSIII